MQQRLGSVFGDLQSVCGSVTALIRLCAAFNSADTPHLAAYRSPGSEQHQHHIGGELPAAAAERLLSRVRGPVDLLL